MKAEKLKILFLVLEMDIGGLQRVVNQMIRIIDRKAFDPYLVCLDRGGAFYDQTAKLCMGSYILRRKPGAFDIAAFVKLMRILRGNKIDIVHSHNGCSLYAAFGGRLSGVKGIVHTDHGRLVPEKKTSVWEDRIASWMIDRIVGVSDELSAYLRSTVRASKSKLTTIINGVDTSIFRPRNLDAKKMMRESIGLSMSDLIVGTVCRLDPVKNLDFMISCISSIVREIPQAKLVIVGDGPSRENLKQKARDLDVFQQVIFLGERKDVEEVMPVFDVYACSSMSEGTSMTILEAMACGLPVVASAVGGNSSLVRDSNGVLFNQNDAYRFSREICRFLKEKSVRVKKGLKSRERAEAELSFTKMVDRYERIYASFQAIGQGGHI